MFRFIKTVFLVTIPFFSGITLNTTLLKCVSMNNQKVLMLIMEPLFYPFSIKTSKCSSSCNNINEPYAKMCVPDVTKNINVRVFSLMPRTIERRHIKRHETCKYKWSLGASVCNNKQRWNKDKCWFKCKYLIDKCVCNKGFIWNPSNCELEWNKSCNVSEYLDY